ncbi:sigma-70 family RNA polymerase sigma factor [Ruegeria sp. MALMAid1280]|uniref:sigma-70 family RNA polymerase sigma factor n=1 Tax=Ruegeria sp. MALMAid1280 TaxID=3411634 RepID=UPI003BA0725C
MNLASKVNLRTGCEGSNPPREKKASFPLHDAAREGRRDVVYLLLERGHSVLTLDGEGLRASDRAREEGHLALADELKGREAEHPPVSSIRSEVERLSTRELINLVQGKSEAVAALIAAGRIQAVDGKGDTPLHICAAQGRLQFCDQLIKAGADPAVSNFERRKPHERAAENGHTMLAGLLRSLLPEVEPVSAVNPYPKQSNVKTESITSSSISESSEDSFDFDDLDMDFYGEEEAEQFHRDIERDDYVAEFEVVEGRVARLGSDDGTDIEFDDLGEGGFWIDAEDIVGPLPQTAEFADAATYRSFLDVRMGRKSAFQATAPTTRYYAIADSAVVQWVENVVAEGSCTEEDVDVLIGRIRGSFNSEAVRANLVHEFTNIGLMQVDDHSHGAAIVAGEMPDPQDIVDLLSCICNGSNMRPGLEFRPLSARMEARLFRELSESQKKICRALVADAKLVSAVVMLGERIEAGTVEPGLLTDLDIQRGRQTQDAEVLSGALSYLVGYQTLLEDGDITSEDRAKAMEAVLAMKLSRLAVELIEESVRVNTELDDAREQIVASLAVRERYRQEILLGHLPLVRRMASRREAHIDDIEDLVHDGVFGLMRSIDLFETDRGHRFMTYCQFGVRQSISRALDDTGSLVRVPAHQAVVLRKVDQLEGGFSEELPAEAVISLISKKMGIPAEIIRKLRRVPRRLVPFEETAEDQLDVDSPQFRDYLSLQRREVIEDFLTRMPERAADVLVRRFGLREEDEMTLEELGAIYGVTRERIRQIEAKRLADLGHPANQRLLRSLL